MHNSRRHSAVLLSLLSLLAACTTHDAIGINAETFRDTPVTIEIAPPGATLVSLGETRPLTAALRAANGSVIDDVPLSWTSSNPAVATVDQAGLVTAVRNGTTAIRANVGAIADSATVVVAQQPSRVVVGQPTGDVAAGLPLSVSVRVEDALGSPVEGFPDAVALTLAPNAQNAQLSGVLTLSAPNGLVTFDEVAISRAGRAFVLRAAAGGLSGASAPFDVRLRLSSISVGGGMACGLAPTGDAYCWGRNRTGGLGTGTSGGNRNRPSRVAGDLVFTQVDAGSGSNIGGILDGGGCGLVAGGAAFCWGRNDFGQLGNGSTGTGSNVPVPVSGDLHFDAINVGRDHACGLASTTLYCWGSNLHGQLGNGQLGVHSNVPVPVSGEVAFTAVFLGDVHTCGRAASGDTYCWGSAAPTLQAGSPIATVPILLSGGLLFADVDPGTFLHMCGVTTGGTGYCWGQDFGFGELGTGTPGQDEPFPAPVTGGHAWAYIGATGQASCGRRTDGAAMCWGVDFNGELGQGTVGASRSSPSAVVGGLSFTSMDVGHGTVCGLTASGDAYCWGLGFWGERGDGTFAPQSAAPGRVVTP